MGIDGVKRAPAQFASACRDVSGGKFPQFGEHSLFIVGDLPKKERVVHPFDIIQEDPAFNCI